MTKKLEKLADEMMRLSPQEGEQLALIIKAKMLPEQAKQQQQQGLLQQQNPGAQQQMARYGARDQVVICLCQIQDKLHNKDYYNDR
jgi:hypothetical protein